MIVRYPCKCATCGQPHTLRIGVGYNPYQEHTFRCGKCGEEVVVAMSVNNKDISFKVHCVNNCIPGSEEGIIINIHPIFTIPTNKLNEDQAFPWLKDVVDLFNEQIDILGKLPEVGSIDDIQELKISVYSIVEEWEIIKKAWSLLISGKDNLAEEHILSYRRKVNDVPGGFNGILLNFCSTLVWPKRLLIFLNAANIVNDVTNKYNSEMLRFRQYYLDELHRDNFNKYYDIFSEYFNDISEYNQTLIYSQYNMALPSSSSASSSAFNRTKMFYGNAYEVLTSSIIILACINNILKGRSYEKFETMDLTKYRTIDKANRANPFIDNEALFEFAKGINSQLRNASHHREMKIDRSNNIITYCSGGKGAVRNMSYAEYLYECNELFLRIVALLMLEIKIASL